MPINDDQLLATFAGIGSYEIEEIGSEIAVEWAAPKGLADTPIKYSLRLVADDENGRQQDVLADLVETWKEFVNGLPELSTRVQQKLVDGFRDVYQGQIDEDELNEVRNSEGEITNESILAAVDSGVISIMSEALDGDAETSIIFTHQVAWDMEHGMSIHVHEDGLEWGE